MAAARVLAIAELVETIALYLICPRDLYALACVCRDARYGVACVRDKWFQRRYKETLYDRETFDSIHKNLQQVRQLAFVWGYHEYRLCGDIFTMWREDPLVVRAWDGYEEWDTVSFFDSPISFVCDQLRRPNSASLIDGAAKYSTPFEQIYFGCIVLIMKNQVRDIKFILQQWKCSGTRRGKMLDHSYSYNRALTGLFRIAMICGHYDVAYDIYGVFTSAPTICDMMTKSEIEDLLSTIREKGEDDLQRAKQIFMTMGVRLKNF